MSKVSFFTGVNFNNETAKNHWQITRQINSFSFPFASKVTVVSVKDKEWKYNESTSNSHWFVTTLKVFFKAIFILVLTVSVVPMAVMVITRLVTRRDATFTIAPKPEDPGNSKKPGEVKKQEAPSSVLEKSTVANLMDRFTKAWSQDSKKFNFPPNSFNGEQFCKDLTEHTKKFKKSGVVNDQHFGYIEKFDLNPADKPRIYMRADLHGDLKSLLENIRSLQREGLLDEKFKCKPGAHLVFLGDYCDRGFHGTEILEMLMRLREENPEQVHLIRGNHEYVEMNTRYAGSDKHLMEVMNTEKFKNALEGFYETMSLTTYFSVHGETREYVQCTHGLFEPAMDPAPLLDQASSGSHLPVPKECKLSDRVAKITSDPTSKLYNGAKQIQKIAEYAIYENSGSLTAYNWADVAEEDENSSPGSLGGREYKLSSKDIHSYLELSSEQHRVMMIFRGHQHDLQHLKHEGQVLVTTLPVGVNSPANREKWGDPDRAYIIRPSGQVKDWNKCAIMRYANSTVTDVVTREHLLTSSVI